MELKINNQLRNFDCNFITIQALIDLELSNKQNGIAIAVNNDIIPKEKWKLFKLSPNDNILIITATQGG